jgi:trans-aconitate 2-methyltransferase
MADTWNPEQYGRFSGHRGRPFADLISRVGASDPDTVVDLGCGPGPLTLSMAKRWPKARIIGVDSSAEMLERARRTDRSERVEWMRSDVESWDPEQVGAPIDVITTNALLQWVPSHQELIPAWISALAPGGWFAMQVPGNFNEPSHALLREVAACAPRAAELLPRLRGGEAVSEPAVYTAFAGRARLRGGCLGDHLSAHPRSRWRPARARPGVDQGHGIAAGVRRAQG